MQLTASVAIYAKDKAPPLILIDDHLPYPQAILRVFGRIKHRRRRNGRGRLKYPRLKPPLDLQVGVVKKIRDSRGNLLKVSTKALFGKKKEIEKRIQKLGIGRKINTSHMERLNGTIRGQQARLARRTRNACFGLRPAPDDRWLNLPSDRHSRRCNLSFADGHVEHWVWKNRRSPATISSRAENEADLADLRRLQAVGLR